MSDYEIYVENCQEVIDAAYGTMDDKNVNFSLMATEATEAATALKPSFVVDNAGTHLDFGTYLDSFQTFYDNLLKPEFDDVCSDIELVIGAFQTALNSYTAGDGEMLARGKAREDGVSEVGYPTVFAKDGSTLHEGGTAVREDVNGDGVVDGQDTGTPPGEPGGIGVFENQEQYREASE